MGANDFIIRVVVDGSAAAPGSKVAAEALEGVTAAGEKAQKSTGDLGERFQRLRREIDPVAAAQQRLISSTELLFAAQRAGITTMAEVARLMEIQQANLRGALEPYEQMLASLTRETELMKLSAGEREVQTRLLQLENELRQQGVLVTTEQTAALEEQIRAQQGLAAVQQAQQAEAAAGSAGKGGGLLGAAGGAVKGLGVALGGIEIVHLADELGNLQNRIRSVTQSDEEMKRVEEELYDVAQHTRTGWEQTAELYQRAYQATRDLGLSEGELVDFTREVNEAFKVAGVSAGEQARVTRDLLHGLDQGTLQWRQLNAIMAQAPSVARLIAEHFGVATGQLKALASQGKITAESIVQTFKEHDAQLEASMGKTVPTLSQAWTKLENAVMHFLEKLAPLLEIIARGINLLGDAIGFVGDHLEAAAVAASMFTPAGPLVLGLDLAYHGAKLLGEGLSWLGGELGISGDLADTDVGKFLALQKQIDEMTDSIDASAASFHTFNALLDMGVNLPAINATAQVHALTNEIKGLQKQTTQIVAERVFGYGDSKGMDSVVKQVTTRSIDDMRKAHTANGEAARKSAEEHKRLEEQLAALAGKASPLAEAQRDLARALDTVTKAEKAGIAITPDIIAGLDERRRKVAELAEIEDRASVANVIRRAQKEADLKDLQAEAELMAKLQAGNNNLMPIDWKEQLTAADELNKRMQSLGDIAKAQVVPAVRSIATQMSKMLVEWKGSWSDFGDLATKVLEQILEKMIEIELLKVAMSLVPGGDPALAGAIAGGAHAYGGSFTAPGVGGADSVPVLFAMTPGETAHFQLPGQPAPGAAAAGQPPDVNVHNHLIFDPSFVPGAMASPAGDRVIMNFIRLNAAQIAQLLPK